MSIKLNVLGLFILFFFVIFNLYRIEKIEFLDELEEWNIMQSHYFVSLATCISAVAKANKSFDDIISKVKINSIN